MWKASRKLCIPRSSPDNQLCGQGRLEDETNQTNHSVKDRMRTSSQCTLRFGHFREDVQGTGGRNCMPKQAPCMYVPCDASMAPAVSWKSSNCCRKRMAWKQGREVSSNQHYISYALLLRSMKDHLSPHTKRHSRNKSLHSFELLCFPTQSRHG